MRQRIAATVRAADAITGAGLEAQLRGRPEVDVVDDETPADVVLVAADEVDEPTLQTLRAARRSGVAGVVLVVGRLDDGGLLTSVENGATGVLRRAESTPERLAEMVVRAARGDGTLSPDLLGRLFGHVSSYQRDVLGPRGLQFSGLTEREATVLRMVADGWDTPAIATKLCYSERTVKNVLHDVTRRYNLRNRSHAVAFALRSGLI